MPCDTPSPPMTNDQALVLLRERIAAYKTQAQSAAALGVSPAHLSDILNGHREISPKLARALGLRKIPAFAPVGECG